MGKLTLGAALLVVVATGLAVSGWGGSTIRGIAAFVSIGSSIALLLLLISYAAARNS